MFYMLYSIYDQVNENMFSGAEQMRIILNLGVSICGIFSVFVLIYTNGFLIEKKEAGNLDYIVYWEWRKSILPK